MSTKDKLKAHKLLALKTRDKSLLKPLNLTLAEIHNFEISKGKGYEATEEEVQGIIAKAVKTRKTSAEEYCKAADSATTEEVKRTAEANYNTELSEAGLLEQYLPQRASEAEMFAAVQDAKLQVEKVGVPKGKQLGIIIKLARKELADRTFDGGQLAKMAKDA